MKTSSKLINTSVNDRKELQSSESQADISLTKAVPSIPHIQKTLFEDLKDKPKTFVDSRVFFTWLIRCTFPNWWAKGTQAWNRTTVSPAPDVVKKNCLKFPFLSHISILFATYIKAVSKKRYISLKVKSHIQMRIFAIIHVKWF